MDVPEKESLAIDESFEFVYDNPHDSSAEDTHLKERPFFFGDLPYLVVMNIFDHFTIGEKLQTASVSKAWRNYAMVSLRSETKIKSRQFPSVRYRVAVDTEIMSRFLLQMSNPRSRKTRLQEIDLNYFQIENTSLQEVLEIVTFASPDLKEFDGSYHESQNFRYFADNCKKLTSLRLGHSGNCMPVNVEKADVSYLMSECIHLKTLELRYSCVEANGESPFENAR